MSKRQPNNKAVPGSSKVPPTNQFKKKPTEAPDDNRLKREMSARRIHPSSHRLTTLNQITTPKNESKLEFNGSIDRRVPPSAWSKKISHALLKKEPDGFPRLHAHPDQVSQAQLHRSKSRQRLELDSLRHLTEKKYASLHKHGSENANGNAGGDAGKHSPGHGIGVVQEVHNESLTESTMFIDFAQLKESTKNGRIRKNTGHFSPQRERKTSTDASFLHKARQRNLKSPQLAELPPPLTLSPLLPPAEPNSFLDVNVSSYNCDSGVDDSPLLPKVKMDNSFVQFLNESVACSLPRVLNPGLQPVSISSIQVESPPTSSHPLDRRNPVSKAQPSQASDLVTQLANSFDDLNRILTLIEQAQGIDLGMSKSVLRSEFINIYSKI
jgi:hypothetical protein